MRPSLYDFAGGDQAFQRLAEAHHERCLADPELNHPFSHDDLNPEHTTRLGWYLAEVMGGPPLYSQRCGSESALVRMHSGNGDMTDLGRRFVECFVSAADDAALPDDPAFRLALRRYMEWATERMVAHPNSATSVPDRLRMPRWTWDGLQES